MLLVAGALVFPVMLYAAGFLRKLVRRSRWLLFSLFLVYSWITPGHPVFPAWLPSGPTHEGVLAGLLQAGRLLLLLAGLSLLHARCSRACLLAGIYRLLHSFSRLGLDVSRATARLWLTLHYAESGGRLRFSDWRNWLRQAEMDVPDDSHAEVTVVLHAFAPADGLALMLMLSTLTGLALW
ncbi:MAG: hypothetical protein ACYC2R_09050 [Burkholderiales bacterium]